MEDIVQMHALSSNRVWHSRRLLAGADLLLLFACFFAFFFAGILLLNFVFAYFKFKFRDGTASRFLLVLLFLLYFSSFLF